MNEDVSLRLSTECKTINDRDKIHCVAMPMHMSNFKLRTQMHITYIVDYNKYKIARTE